MIEKLRTLIEAKQMAGFVPERGDVVDAAIKVREANAAIGQFICENWPTILTALTAASKLEVAKEALQQIADIDRYWRTTSRQSLATGDTHYDDKLVLGQFAQIASRALAAMEAK